MALSSLLRNVVHFVYIVCLQHDRIRTAARMKWDCMFQHVSRMRATKCVGAYSMCLGTTRARTWWYLHKRPFSRRETQTSTTHNCITTNDRDASFMTRHSNWYSTSLITRRVCQHSSRHGLLRSFPSSACCVLSSASRTFSRAYRITHTTPLLYWADALLVVRVTPKEREERHSTR